MITPTEYIQLKAFARQDGFFMGLIWVIAFACFIGSMKDPGLQIGFMIGFLCTPFVAFYFLRQYRDKVLQGYVSYRRAFVFTSMTMLYASVIIAAATFVYFTFLDDGTFFGVLMNNIKLPEVQKSFADAGMNPKDIESQMQLIALGRPIDFAFSVFFEGVIMSVILSGLLAVLGFRRQRVVTDKQP